MASAKGLTREITTQTLVDALEPLDYIYAFWEGGAAAFKSMHAFRNLTSIESSAILLAL